MDGEPESVSTTRIVFGVSSTRRVHGLLVSAVLAAAGIAALFAAGPALPDGQSIGAVTLLLACGIVFYVTRSARNTGTAMVLDKDGLWFRDWGLPPVPWRHIAGARIAGNRIRPLLHIDLDEGEAFFADVDDGAEKRRPANPLVRPTRLLVPNGAVDAPLTDIVEAIRRATADGATPL